MQDVWKTFILLNALFAVSQFLGALAVTYPQHLGGYPQCYLNGTVMNCTDGWTSGLNYVYMGCYNNSGYYSSSNHCSGNCSGTETPSLECSNQYGMLTWYSSASDASSHYVSNYWCTSGSSSYSCGQSGCNCYNYCGNGVCDGSCSWQESCGTDCPTETACQDGSDNDWDGLTDTSDSDCPPCAQTETNCQDGIDNDCDTKIDGCDSDCPPGSGWPCTDRCPASSEAGWCHDGVDNDCDGGSDYWGDSDCQVPPSCGDHICDYMENCASDCSPEHRCSDWFDNDNDGLMDMNDTDCAGFGGCDWDKCCDPGETVYGCPNDCCDPDCTSKTDSKCNNLCNDYNGCVMDSYFCNNENTGLNCYTDTSYIICCDGNIYNCNPGEYCSNGFCFLCSSQCDGSCPSQSCLNDPDCTDGCGAPAPGQNATDRCAGVNCDDSDACTTDTCNETTGVCKHVDKVPCCGNGQCEQGENSYSCPEDCFAEGQLTLRINYPRANSTYFRGNVTNVRAQANYGSQVVSDANITCVDPSGGAFELEFTPNLVYSYDYTIEQDDPAGAWNLTCSGFATIDSEGKEDADSIQLMINNRVVIDIIELPDVILQGENFTVAVNVTYDDGTPVEDANMTVLTPGGNFSFTGMGGGLYEAFVTINTLGAFNMSFTAQTTGLTVQLDRSSVSVKPFDIRDYLWLFAAGLVSSVALFFGYRKWSVIKVRKDIEGRVRSKEARRQEIEAEKKALQNDFLETKVTESDFKKRIDALDREYQRLDIEVNEMKEQAKEIKEKVYKDKKAKKPETGDTEGQQ